jgi:hypothetical protein
MNWKLVSEPNGPPDTALRWTRKYVKLTKIIALFFMFSVAALVPFLDNNPLNRYWRPFGQAIVLTAGGLWLALIFTGGMAFIHWQAHKGFEKSLALRKGK